MPSIPSRGLAALTGRETARVLKLWTQTVAAPILSSFLFIAVFGLSLGGRIRQIDGVPYDVFIVPGLITMAMIQAAYANNSSSVFQARFDRYLNDVLASPMRPWEVNLGLSLGGVVRALLIGGGLLVASLAVVDVPVREPLVLALAMGLGLTLFAAFGVVVGIYAKSWDQSAFIQNIVILPAELPRRRLLLGRPAAGALGAAVPRQPDLLPPQRGPVRLPRHERRERRGSRSAVTGALAAGRGRVELMAVQDRPAPEALTDRVPPVALLLAGATSVQFGAALAATLFDDVGPAGTSMLRLVLSAAVLALFWRPAIRGLRRGRPPARGRLRPGARAS